MQTNHSLQNIFGGRFLISKRCENDDKSKISEQTERKRERKRESQAYRRVGETEIVEIVEIVEIAEIVTLSLDHFSSALSSYI